MKISVICVTNRPGAAKFLMEQLDKQTFPVEDYEVIIADDSHQTDYISERIKWFTPRQKNEGDVWNINKAYNDCLDKVSGELIVFLQDFIWIPANGLQRFWDDYKLHPDALVTGVGHKAKTKLKGISEVDDRVFGTPGLHPANFTFYELNWASCPTKIAPRFDEDMDTHYGGENQLFAAKSKADVYIDRSNVCVGYSQEDCGGRPESWEKNHVNKTTIMTEKIKEYGYTFTAN